MMSIICCSEPILDETVVPDAPRQTRSGALFFSNLPIRNESRSGLLFVRSKKTANLR
jgi:hypothetical protein